MNSGEITKSLDTSGRCCPMPIIDMNKAMNALHGGDVLEIIATDPGTRSDVPAWCERTGNELLSFQEQDKLFKYYIKKAG